MRGHSLDWTFGSKKYHRMIQVGGLKMFKVCVSLILAIPTVIHDPSCISIDMFRHVYNMGC
jgi:hypothetical protein